MRTINGIELDEFTLAYFECALWSTYDQSNEAGGNPLSTNYDLRHCARETLQQGKTDCDAFRSDAGELLSTLEDALAGHDFWLTRNRHGAGFWDRGLGRIGDRLTDLAHSYKEIDLYVGDDTRLYFA